MTDRAATIHRKTKETETPDPGSGRAGEDELETGVPFLEHMLDLFAKHGLFDLRVMAKGDVRMDDHHTVEDIAICLGTALRRALGDKAGIRRYGHACHSDGRVPGPGGGGSVGSPALGVSGRVSRPARGNLCHGAGARVFLEAGDGGADESPRSSPLRAEYPPHDRIPVQSPGPGLGRGPRVDPRVTGDSVLQRGALA